MSKVALYKKGNYIVGELYRNDTIFHEDLNCNVECRLLKSKGYTKELIKKHPDVDYSESEDYFTIRPKEKEKITVPVVVKYFDKYRYIGKYHTYIKPTEKGVHQLYDVLDKIMCELKIQQIKEIVKNEGGIAFVPDTSYNVFGDLYWYPIVGYGTILVDRDNITSLELTLKVPKNCVGRVIGKGGCIVKAIAHDICVKRINVEAI